MARILVVAREAEGARNLAALLRGDGHATEIARTGPAAARALVSGRPDLMVLALSDPAGTLRDLARTDRALIRRTPAVAVVHEGETPKLDRNLPGLLELLPTPFSGETFLARIDALVRVRQVLFDRHGSGSIAERASAEASERSESRGALRTFLDALTGRHHSDSLRKERPLEPYLETAASIVGTVEGRDAFDPGHGQRVVGHCAAIAQFMGLKAEETSTLLFAASVHDIGKIVISAEILRKPALTDADRKLMKFHPRRGAELIRALTPYEQAADAVFYHHERPDGKGYYGCGPEEVPLLSRILAVAEVFEGMTSGCAGGPHMTQEEAIESLKLGRGVSYDAECVDALVSAVHPRQGAIPLSPIPGFNGVPLKSSGPAH